MSNVFGIRQNKVVYADAYEINVEYSASDCSAEQFQNADDFIFVFRSLTCYFVTSVCELKKLDLVGDVMM